MIIVDKVFEFLDLLVYQNQFGSFEVVLFGDMDVGFVSWGVVFLLNDVLNYIFFLGLVFGVVVYLSLFVFDKLKLLL